MVAAGLCGSVDAGVAATRGLDQGETLTGLGPLKAEGRLPKAPPGAVRLPRAGVANGRVLEGKAPAGVGCKIVEGR